MKTLTVSLVAITLLLFGNLCVSAQEPAAKPTFKEGDTWQFNTTRSKVASTAQTLGITELDYTQGRLRPSLSRETRRPRSI